MSETTKNADSQSQKPTEEEREEAFRELVGKFVKRHMDRYGVIPLPSTFPTSGDGA